MYSKPASASAADYGTAFQVPSAARSTMKTIHVELFQFSASVFCKVQRRVTIREAFVF
jgi:hypothetical protein